MQSISNVFRCIVVYTQQSLDHQKFSQAVSGIPQHLHLLRLNRLSGFSYNFELVNINILQDLLNSIALAIKNVCPLITTKKKLYRKKHNPPVSHEIRLEKTVDR